MIGGVGLFVAGLVTGLLWREGYELIKGRDDPMSLFKRILSVRVEMLTAGLIVAILFNCLVGAGLVISDNRDQAEQRCQAEYNLLSGQARDERLAIAADVAEAQLDFVREDLRYQRGLLAGLESDLTSIEPLTNVIRTRAAASQTYLETLEAQKKVRLSTDYPPPDYCEGDR
jgi:hypothetical protein